MSRAQLMAIVAAASALSACGNVQTSFGGQGEHGAQFITLFAIFLGVTAAVYLLVIGFLIAAIVRRRRADGDANVVENRSHHASHPLLKPVLFGWAALIAVGLSGLTLASFLTDRSHARASSGETLSINVTANQFWWDVEYVSADSSRMVRTANELHLPVGVPVRIRLRSNDVIHSLWIPNLAGKQDLIPGRFTDLSLLPRQVGLYRGRCAEFCGVQHAHMALDVQVESRAEFARWWNRQLATAAPPRTPLALAGYNYVTTRECRMCHNISGTPASGRIAPDLTHVASRRSIAAGTLPMNRGNLYAWIADPQSQKPGNHMPTVGLEARELHAIVAYLEGLK
jgi:cytochrome c oxidase subunit II